MRIAFALVVSMLATTAAAAADFPKKLQGTWADGKFATCKEINSAGSFKDGGFVYIHGDQIEGHEWNCRAGKKSASGEYALDCGGEGEEWEARARFERSGHGLVIRWTDFDQGKPVRRTWTYPSWCRSGAPAFWTP